MGKCKKGHRHALEADGGRHVRHSTPRARSRTQSPPKAYWKGRYMLLQVNVIRAAGARL
jgi:hypothetical protein